MVWKRFIESKLKAKLKRFDLVMTLWTQYLDQKHTRTIRNEQKYYEVLAKKLGIYTLSREELRTALCKKLLSRGIDVGRKRSLPLHVLYASHFGEWETFQIPHALQKFGPVSLYSLPERGFYHERENWLKVRHKLDEDLLNFVRTIHTKRPIDVFIGYLNGLQVSPVTIQTIGKLGIVTVTFNFDDRLLYRGRKLGGRWTGSSALASSFDLNLTNSSRSVIKYMVDGGLAMFWPPGANPDFFKPLDLPFEYDVSFIGANYGSRRDYIKYLRRNGIRVVTFGKGWPSGPVESKKMVEIYSKSRINLGFSWVGASSTETCLKGRDFEVPMSGGVYLTTDQPDIYRVYKVGLEVETYKSKEDCLQKIRYLLSNPEKCRQMRRAVRKRCVEEHSWEARFKDLFNLLFFE